MSKRSDDDNLALELPLQEVELEEVALKKTKETQAAKLAKLQQKITKLKKESSKMLQEMKDYRLTCEDANQTVGALNGKLKGK